MGLFKKIFGSGASPQPQQADTGYSQGDVDIISASAMRLIEIINESVELANNSSNPQTKIHRIELAAERMAEVKAMAAKYTFLNLTSLSEVEEGIARLTASFSASPPGKKNAASIHECATGNMRGQELEKSGKTEAAIIEYEKLVSRQAETPHTYKRLAIIYKKQKKPDDELRVVRAALSNVPSSNQQHYAWFQARLKKCSTS